MSNAPQTSETPGQNPDPVELLKDLEHPTMDTARKKYSHLRDLFLEEADVDEYIEYLDTDEDIDLTRKQLAGLKATLAGFKVYLKRYLEKSAERIGSLGERLKKTGEEIVNPDLTPEEVDEIAHTRKRVAKAMQIAKAPRGVKGKSLREVTQKGAPTSSEKVLTSEQKMAFLSKLETDFAANPKRHEGIQWSDIKKALEAASEEALYGLNQMEENGHEVRAVRALKDGKKGLRFDSCSAESPKGIRDIDYYQAEKIAGEWGIDLMDPKVFDELRLKYNLNRSTWDHLKTDEKTLKTGGSFYGGDDGLYERNATDHNANGGFRGSLWVLEA
jgi:hypothetical protein